MNRVIRCVSASMVFVVVALHGLAFTEQQATGSDMVATVNYHSSGSL